MPPTPARDFSLASLPMSEDEATTGGYPRTMSGDNVVVAERMRQDLHFYTTELVGSV
jgi:hypothetical protein